MDPKPNPTERRLRVAVVDDDPDQRELVREFLGEVGIVPCGEAEDAESGLRLVGEVHPDVLIVDYTMPGEDGTVLTRRVVDRHPEVEIIAFTASTDPSVEIAFAQAGASRCFRKSDLPLLVQLLSERAARQCARDDA